MLLLLAIATFATAPDSVYTKSPDSLRIELPKVSHRPVLDGKLDDEIWREAAQLRDFIQGEPKDKSPPMEKSIGYVAYDDEYFYFAFRAYERDPSLIHATVFPRERGGESDDRITILLDTFLDRRRAFEFKNNPFGIQTDGIKIEGHDGDPSPDFVWYSAGRRDDAGWVVEMMIPWASLRFPASRPLSIGFNAVRVYGRNGEKDSWAPRLRGNPCEICEEGILTGITGINGRRPIDVLPYVASSQLGSRAFGTDSAKSGGAYYGTMPPLDFSRGHPQQLIGGDVRVPLTTAAILNATFNPDFSQVESDDGQIQTNQRFTLFQSERRPFFLEGADLFTAGVNESAAEQRTSFGDMFYTRAIVDPSAGVRLTAKQSGWALGTLYAKDHTPAYFHYNKYESSGYLPLTGQAADVVVARLRRDMLADSYAGVSVFGRRIGESHNSIAAGDFSFRRGALNLRGEGALSDDRAPRVPGFGSALDGANRAGKFYRLRFSRAGPHLTYTLSTGGADSLFRDQLGQFARVGVQKYFGLITVSQLVNNSFVQRVDEGFTGNQTNRFGAGLLDYSLNPYVGVQFQRQTWVKLTAHRELITLFEVPVHVDGGVLEVNSLPSQRFGMGGFLYFGGREIVDPNRPRPGHGYLTNWNFIVRPIAQASLEVRGQRSWHTDRWGDPLVDDAKIIRVKGTYQFTRALGIRLITERSNQFSTLISNPLNRRSVRNAYSGLVSYELGPSSFVYAGYNEAAQDFLAPVVASDRSLKTGSQLFIKISYLLRM